MQTQTSMAGNTVAADETHRLISYDMVVGISVYNLQGEHFGSRQRLEGAPSYNAGSMPDWSDRAYGHRVDTYYGVPPYDF